VFKNRVIAEGSWNEGDDTDNIWKEMVTHNRKMTIEVFGVTRENKCKPKDTWERVIEHRLRKLTTISKNQFGFMLGRSTMEAIFLIRQLMERHRETEE
jgi:hypothetical protein